MIRIDKLEYENFNIHAYIFIGEEGIRIINILDVITWKSAEKDNYKCFGANKYKC